MFIGRIKKRVFLITCLAAIVALIIPCPSFGAKSEKKYLITETELQSELMAFADRLASYLHQALRDFERAPGMQEMRPMVQKDVVISSASAIAIAAEPDPGTAILYMVAMVSMDKAGQEGEELIDLSFKRGILLTLFAVVALLLAQIMYALIKRKRST